jgi:hypothetical protein
VAKFTPSCSGRNVRLPTAKDDERRYDLTILFGYVVFAILLMVVIYFAAGGSGTAAADFATISTFP